MSGKLEKWFGIIGMIFACIALILSWQANSIAKEQLSPNVMIIDLYGSGVGGSIGADAYCWAKVKLANLGGESTSIARFTGNISFLEDNIVLYEYSNNWLRSRNETLFQGNLHSFSATIELAQLDQASPGFSRSNTPPEFYLPLEIKKNSTVMLFFVVRFNKGKSIATYQSSSEPDLRKQALQAEYQLYFSDGESLPIPKTNCQWYLPRPEDQ